MKTPENVLSEQGCVVIECIIKFGLTKLPQGTRMVPLAPSLQMRQR